MKRVPFEILTIEVDKLFDKFIDETDESAISKHIDFIRVFINAAGWTEEEYCRRDFGFDQTN